MKKSDLAKTPMNLINFQYLNTENVHNDYGCVHSVTTCVLSLVVEDRDNNSYQNIMSNTREESIYPSIANQMAFQFNYCPICGKDLREEDN